MTGRRGYQVRRALARRFVLLGVGAIVALAAVMTVAFDAHKGLPWQERYEIYVEVPNADRLTETDKVNLGGIRIGQVSSVETVPAASGREPSARIGLRLDPSVEPLPADSTIRVRPGAVLGASYVDLVLGHSTETIEHGGTLPLAQATRAVQLNDLFATFDQATAAAMQRTLREGSAGLAGRGPSANAWIGSVAELLPPLGRVSARLANPDTELPRFLAAYDDAVTGFGRVAPELGSMVTGAASTFDALAGASGAMGEAIEVAPGAERATTRAFVALQPTLDGLAGFFEDLRPATPLIDAAVTESNRSLAAGLRPVREFPRFAGRLRTAFRATERLVRAPGTSGAIRKLTDVLGSFNVLLEVLAPAQRTCNTLALWAQNFGTAQAPIGFGEGPGLGMLAVSTNGAKNEGLQSKEPAPDVGINYEAIANDQECESGNEPVDGKQHLSNPEGLQPASTRDTDPPPLVIERARSVGLIGDGR